MVAQTSARPVKERGRALTDPLIHMIMSRVEVRSPGHEEEEDLARLRPGDYFGEMAVLTGEPRSASVMALGDVTLVTMDREAFAELFAREPNAAHALAEVLAQRREGLSRAMAASSDHATSPPQHPSQFLEKLRRIFRQL